MAKTSPLIAAWLLALATGTQAANPPPPIGKASWYGAECAGKPMANGKPFDPAALTCASWFYPLGTQLRVRSGDKVVVVTVTDRGPAKRLVEQGRIIDLSEAAFAQLGSTKLGLLSVNVTKLEK